MNLLGFFVLCASISFGLAARDELYVYNKNTCMCPGQNITYECSVIGGLFTVWNGSIMTGNCTIPLIHNQFESSNGFCDTGSNTVFARGVRVENNCYVSQLIVLANPDLDGRTIECCIDYGPMSVAHIGTETLNLTKVPFPPPSNLQLIDATPSELTFMWVPPLQQCPSLTFNIISDNCGVCESMSTQTTTTCSNFILATVCIMKVYSVICENLVSLFPSNTVNATLKVPEAPSIITCVPYYSESDDKLLSIQTNFSTVEPFPISDGVDGSATNYTLSYSDNMGASCGLGTVLPSSCENKVCSHIFEISTSSYSQISGIYITVFATNILGDGYTNQIFKDGVNRLVRVMFDSNTQNINCTFLNEPLDSAKECRATVSYGANCENYLGMYTGSADQGNTLITHPAIEPSDDTTKYCFTVQARSGNKTVVVNGTFNTLIINLKPIFTDGIIAAIVVVPVITIIILGGSIIGVLLLYFCTKSHQGARRQVITRFSSKHTIRTLLNVLKVFKDHKINIIGFNAYFEPKQLHRKEVQLHLRYARQDRETLERILEPSSPQFLDNDELSTSEEIYTTAILSLKDKLGALWKSLKAIKEGIRKVDSLKLEGVNTCSIQTLSTPDGYRDMFISCLCPQRIDLQNISDKLEDAGAININFEFSLPTQKFFFMFMRNRVSLLIKALKIFGDFNISVIGLDDVYAHNQKIEDRRYYVECKRIEENQTDSVFRKLKSFGAKECLICEGASRKSSNRADSCVIELTVRDEIGSLAAVLQGFIALGMEIISINFERRDPKSKRVPYRSIQIECDALRPDVDEQNIIEDLEATGCVDNPRIGDSKRQIDFDIKHTSGALIEALKVLFKYEVNMTKIKNEEIPIYVEYECHSVEFIATDDQERQLISKLNETGFIVEQTLNTDSNVEEDSKKQESSV